MRDSYPRTTRSALVWIISATVAGFILANVFERLFLTRQFTDLFGLSVSDVKQGLGWQLLSYAFVHQPGDLFDVLIFSFNLLTLYLLGRELESLLGSKRFIWLYLGAVFLGGLAWFAMNYRAGGQHMGAWSGIAALFTLYAFLNADQKIPLLVFFVFPVTLKPKYLVWGLLIFELCGLIFFELPHSPTRLGYHSPHLAGMLAGYLYYRFIYEREWRTPDGLTEIELPTWFRKKQKAPEAAAPVYKINLDRDALRAEVDRILDKINSEGFGALTTEEKQLLDDAKDTLSRH